ncbi:hypothetical protein CU097_012911 [Rhizopus azygosporus]|uniref:RRM domain-containing protein n=2 Tax=Rhizopus TaxID=4842 RepID=A0A367K2R7_RHIAZ|nr:hypothetical protein BCV71DRAFT_197832 [Rhizopus microsporus]RCH96425.1 hypothetical protein CU097_012911 [Rhizopus azygosporus]
MSTPLMSENIMSRSRSSSFRRVYRNKDIGSAPNSRPSSRPSSRPPSRPASRPVSPTPVNPADSDDIIPTAIVIKNIPFSVKKDALLEKLKSLGVPEAYAFNYHFDNGIFRGLAFANYRTPEETDMVVNTVNGLEIGGRKLRVEYKKVLTEADINKKKERESSQPNSPLLSERKLPASPTTATATTTASGTVAASDEDALDLNDPNVLELYSYLLLFRNDPNSTELALPKSFSAKERRDAHLIADRLGLAHYSEGFGPDRQVIIEKRGNTPAPIMRLHQKSSRPNLRQSPSRERLSNGNTSSNSSPEKGSYRKSMMSTSTTADDASSDTITFHPIRQPKGPEPGKNFASRANELEVEQLTDKLTSLLKQ